MSKSVLVTGATGYIGGQLVPRLLNRNYTVRCLVRNPEHVPAWKDSVQLVQGDLLKPSSIEHAFKEIDVAYYLVHSMGGDENFQERDREAARNFGQAAKAAGVKQVIYLGGLGDPSTELSRHLKSRQETGTVLKEFGPPVTEFRAAVIIGSGSLSFELVRYLTERLPVMICPKWVYTKAQPIGIDDVISYLIAALEEDGCQGRIIEIGGETVMTYGEMILNYAKIRGLRRYLIPVPVLTPRLSSYWVRFVTPLPTRVTRPLIDGLRNEVIVRNDDARRIFPAICPVSFETATIRALHKDPSVFTKTSFNKQPAPSVRVVTDEGMIRERRRLNVKATATQIYKTITTGIGREHGWLYLNSLWQLRGGFDKLIGGVGMRRGMNHRFSEGEILDFWRIEAIEPQRLLRLRAEMKVPGRAWLQFQIIPKTDNQCELVQTAFFEPKGLFGLLYWWILYPAHSLIFSGMIKRIAEKSQGG